jgi:hypothetical protein
MSALKYRNKTTQTVALLILLTLSWAFNPLHAMTCRAVDGDTLACGKQRIRLADVYAAEINEPGGQDAKQRLSALVRGQNITLQPVAHDKYGRTVAQVFVNGRPITQTDIGPRAGRGADYKPYARTSKPRTSTGIYRNKATKIRQPRQAGAKRAPRQPSQVRPYFKRDGKMVRGHRRKG